MGYTLMATRTSNNNARYKRELREKIQTQTQEYILRFEPLLYIPTFTQNDFHYVHTRPSTKGPPPRNYNSHNSSLNTQAST